MLNDWQVPRLNPQQEFRSVVKALLNLLDSRSLSQIHCQPGIRFARLLVEPVIVQKGQTLFDGFAGKILSLYPRGMSVRYVRAQLQDLYGVEVSAGLISKVTYERHIYKERHLIECLFSKIKQYSCSQLG